MYKSKLYPEHELLIQEANTELRSKSTKELKQLLKISNIKISKLKRNIKKLEDD